MAHFQSTDCSKCFTPHVTFTYIIFKNWWKRLPCKVPSCSSGARLSRVLRRAAGGARYSNQQPSHYWTSRSTSYGAELLHFLFHLFSLALFIRFSTAKGSLYVQKRMKKKQCTLLILGVSCQFESHKFPPLKQPGSKHFNKIGVFLCLAADITNEWA